MRLAPAVWLLLIAAAVGLAERPDPGSAVDALSRTQARAVARAAAGVVTIQPAAGGRARSGVVLAPGLVVTCATHVQGWGRDTELVVIGDDGQPVPATLRGRDMRLRVVLLEAPELQAPALPLSPGPHRAGAFVQLVGRTLGAPTTTAGILSATERFEGRAYQTDAELDATNAGGALIDLEGRLVAVAVHVHDRLGDRSGVGFGVPAPRILAVLEPLQRGFHLEPGRLGVVVSREDAGQGGIPVRGVVPQSAAARAGFAADDVILSIEGRPTPDPTAFRQVVADLYAGQRVVVEVRRGQQTRKLPLTIEPLP